MTKTHTLRFIDVEIAEPSIQGTGPYKPVQIDLTDDEKIVMITEHHRTTGFNKLARDARIWIID